MIDPREQTTRLLGFVVDGRPPRVSARMATDRFELRHVAIECARLLDDAGWTHIRCGELIEEYGEEFRTEIDWRAS